MKLDRDTPGLITLNVAANFLRGRAARGRYARSDLALLLRWATRGVNGAVLPTVRLGPGSVRHTTAKALAEFLQACRQPAAEVHHAN